MINEITNNFHPIERTKLMLAMDYIARHVNNEELFYNEWLQYGIPDGEIPYGELDHKSKNFNIEWMIEDDEIVANIMQSFLNLMLHAFISGGLYCNGVTSREATDE